MRLLNPATTSPIPSRRPSQYPFHTLTYRRGHDGNIWHYHPNCSQWPEDAYDEQRETPFGYSFCKDCGAHVEADYMSLSRNRSLRGLASA